MGKQVEVTGSYGKTQIIDAENDPGSGLPIDIPPCAD
jgi:hypothetical protein